jgi:hypothetical protein
MLQKLSWGLWALIGLLIVISKRRKEGSCLENIYNVNKTFDYFTIKAMVIESLEKIVREELNRRIGSINLHKIIDIQEDIVIANTSKNLFGSHPKKYNRISKLAYCNLKAR